MPARGGTSASASPSPRPVAQDGGTPPVPADDHPLRLLLQSVGAEAAFEALHRECVDIEALALMGEDELREASVPLGPRMYACVLLS